MKLTNFLQTIVYLIWDMRKLKNTHTKVLWIFLWIFRSDKIRTYRSFLLLPTVHQSMCTTNTELKPVPTCTSTVERRRPVAGSVNYWQGFISGRQISTAQFKADKAKGLRHEKNLVVKHCCTGMNSLKWGSIPLHFGSPISKGLVFLPSLVIAWTYNCFRYVTDHCTKNTKHLYF